MDWEKIGVSRREKKWFEIMTWNMLALDGSVLIAMVRFLIDLMQIQHFKEMLKARVCPVILS